MLESKSQTAEGATCQMHASEQTTSIEQAQEACARRHHVWDRAGITLSLICALHCALLPILAFVFPLLLNFSDDRWFHVGMAVLVVPIGIFALYRGYQENRNKNILVAGLLGIIFLFAGLMVPNPHVAITELGGHHHHHHDPHHSHSIFSLGGLLTLPGSLLLIYAHFKNLWQCRHRHS